MLKIAVCDDSKEYLDQAVELVQQWSNDSGIAVDICSFEDGDSLLHYKSSNQLDIIILDIIMPLLNGIDTAKEIRMMDKAAKILFLTTSPEFALDSYDVKASGYLLKPVVYSKLKEALDECNQAFVKDSKNITLKTTYGYQKIYFHDIEFAEAQNKKVVFYLRSGNTVEVIAPLNSLEERFTIDDGFFKCHRSYLVYLPNVDHFNSTDITMKSGRCIPIARGCGKQFQEAYFSQMFEN